MKKLIGLFIGLIFMSACQTQDGNNKNNQTIDKQENKKIKIETNERKADDSQTKFVLFKSDYEPKETYVKLKNYLEGQGMYHPRLVDHQTAAANADIKLRPVYLMIFGNPKEGSLLIKENPEVAIELPLKALIYQDEEGQTWVLYKDMNYLKNLYYIKDANGVIPKMNKLMEGFKQAVYNPIRTTQIKEEELK